MLGVGKERWGWSDAVSLSTGRAQGIRVAGSDGGIDVGLSIGQLTTINCLSFGRRDIGAAEYCWQQECSTLAEAFGCVFDKLST